MKKLFTLKYLLTFVLLIYFTSKMHAQTLVEDFNYPATTLLTANGYTNISGTTNFLTVTGPSLTPAGSPSSGVGNAVTMTTSGEDVTKVFAPAITSGDAYASFFVNVTSAQATGDYFFILNDGSTFRPRVYVRSSGAGFVFGVSKSTTSIVYETTVRSFSTIHLVVLKYTFNPIATDDVVSLYVNPVLGSPEPTATIAPTTNGGATDAVSLDRIALRQGAASSASAQVIDGIRVGTTWASVTPVSTPTTSSISPTNANAGTPGLTLTVNGTNFINGSNVTWNGSNRTTTFVNSTQLTATITPADMSTAGTATVGVTTIGAASTSNTQIFTINAVAGGTFTLQSPIADFGNVCINTTSIPNSFTLDGNNLDGSNASTITIASLNGFSFSETPIGGYNTTLSFTYTGNSFTGKIIYVTFTPIVIQTYDGNLILNGGGISNYPVPVKGSGVNSAPSVTTNAATTVTATNATLSGTISSIGCAAVTAYGFEYSTATGFPNGTGTLVSSNNLSGGNFSSAVIGLLPNTRYYYKAFATNSIGTTYGLQQAFTNTPLPVLISAQQNLSFTQTFSDVGTWGSFFTSGNGANNFGGLSATNSAPASGIPSPTITTASSSNFNSNTFTSSGGIHRFIDSSTATQSIIFLSTGSPDNTTATALDFYMDFTGLNAGTLSFDYATVNNSTGNRNGSFRVYATIDGITFNELTFASVLEFTNNVPISGSKTNIQLPALFNNSATARLRFYYHNGSAGTGSGSRPKISIDNLTVTGIATTPCVQPTAPATSLVFGNITDTTIAASFTAASPITDNYLIVMSTSSTLTGNPLNTQNYALGDNVGDGTVIAKGVATSFIATGLSAQTTYYFFIFPMNAVCTGGPLYYTTSVLNGSASTIAGLPTCLAPTNQPSNLNFGTTTTNSIAGSFTAIIADQYLVVRSTSNSLGANPINGTAYNPGDVIGTGIVVQRSSATTFTANGLLPNTTYYFFVFSVNNLLCISGPAYNIITPLTLSTATLPLPPCTTPTSQATALSLAVSNTAISGTFTGVSDADNYLIIKSTIATLSATTSDNIDYNPGDVFGNGTVLSNTTSTTFYATGLTPNTTYYFFIFAANKICSGGTKYNSINPLSGNITTSNNGVNNYYFGTLHSHSDYSDGNADNPGFTPAQNYAYAKNSLCMDYLGISEHNHFSSANNPGNQILNYKQGTVQANIFNSSNPNFLALYGMEWGVISGGGHVLVYGDNMDDLWGWETGAGTWGPTNNYDVYVPKSTYTGTTGIFKTVNDNIAKNTFATLAHPSLTDYNNIGGIVYDAVADNAIVGTAVESGPAFSTNTNYSNPGSSLSYLFYYQLMLSKGYRLGPTIDHDNHNTTFGRTTTSRTAIVSPSLDKTSIIGAMRKMNFYATQDCDTKVDFTINTKIMGSTLSDRFGPNIFVSLSDASTSLSSAVIRVMYGAPGSGATAVKIDSAIGNTLSFKDNNLANLATGYYYIDISNGTSRIITSPIWYTRNDALTALPVKLSSFSVSKEETSVKLKWTTEQEINSRSFEIEKSIDGSTWNFIGKMSAAGNSNTKTNYTFFDNDPYQGINYYRLKQVDNDGKFVYSVVKSVLFSKLFEVRIIPNPATTFINIYITKKPSINTQIFVSDVNGKIIEKQNTMSQQKEINTSNYAKGIYFIKTITANNVITQKIIVQ